MPPRIGLRLGHPKELSWPFLHGMLGHRRQHEEPLIGDRGERTMVIRTIPPAGAGLPRTGAVLQRGRPRVRKMRQQRLECWWREAGHRLSTPGTLDHILVAWPRPLQDAIVSAGDSLTLNLDNV
jgi:hypothetical protein